MGSQGRNGCMETREGRGGVDKGALSTPRILSFASGGCSALSRFLAPWVAFTVCTYTHKHMHTVTFSHVQRKKTPTVTESC